MNLMSPEDVSRRLAALDGWAQTPQGLQKRYEMGSFLSAMNLVNRVADLAEEASHHPEIRIDHGEVTFTLMTRDAGGITEKDFDLASRIEAVAP